MEIKEIECVRNLKWWVWMDFMEYAFDGGFEEIECVINFNWRNLIWMCGGFVALLLVVGWWGRGREMMMDDSDNKI